MSSIVYLLLYKIPWYAIVLIMVGTNYLYQLWNEKLRIKRKKYLLFWLISFFGAIYIIMYFTILNRAVESVQECNYIPFRSLWNSKFDKSVIKTMILNVFLFYPLGLSLHGMLTYYNFKKNKLIIILALTFALSCFLEIFQYINRIGTAEIDDIICNSIGGLFAGTGGSSIRIKRRM